MNPNQNKSDRDKTAADNNYENNPHPENILKEDTFTMAETVDDDNAAQPKGLDR